MLRAVVGNAFGHLLGSLLSDLGSLFSHLPILLSSTAQEYPRKMKHSRRAFLEGGLAWPAVLNSAPELSAAPLPKSASSLDSSFDPWVEIRRENLRHNVAEIARRVSARPILAIIKNNGYGTSVANIAQLLEPQREIFGFAIVKLHE